MHSSEEQQPSELQKAFAITSQFFGKIPLSAHPFYHVQLSRNSAIIITAELHAHPNWSVLSEKTRLIKKLKKVERSILDTAGDTCTLEIVPRPNDRFEVNLTAGVHEGSRELTGKYFGSTGGQTVGFETIVRLVAALPLINPRDNPKGKSRAARLFHRILASSQPSAALA